MSTDEMLVRLTQQGRNEAAAFFRDDGSFDFAACIAAGKAHLIRSVSITEGEKSSSRRVELYDAKEAMTLIGKHHRMWGDSPPEPVRDITVTFLRSMEQTLDLVYSDKKDEEQAGEAQPDKDRP